jgi:hypothetical protein
LRCFESFPPLRALWVVGLIVAAIAVTVACGRARCSSQNLVCAHAGAVVGIDALVAVFVFLCCGHSSAD